MKLITVSTAVFNNIQITNMERIVIRIAMSIGAIANIKIEKIKAIPKVK